MNIYSFDVTIRRADKSHFTYSRGWEGNTEEAARRALLNELFACELNVVKMETIGVSKFQ